MRGSLRERFFCKFDRSESGCWEWTANRNNKGYGMIGAGGKRGRQLLAHRVAYELFRDEIPEGLVIDHLCRNPGCVNPDHLETVKQSENVWRGMVERRSTQFCIHGHEFTPENTIFPRAGGRQCRICNNARGRKWRAEQGDVYREQQRARYHARKKT